jgi:hypothetical protein
MKKPKRPQSGKCGNEVWRIGQHGPVCYPLVIPVNPRTPAQVAVRDNVRALAVRWHKLAEEQRALWIKEASGHPSKIRLHQRGALAGWNLFHKLNLALAYYGREQLDVPSRRPRFPQLAVSGLVITNGPGGIRISLACPRDPGDHTVLSASFSTSARRTTWTDYRFFAFCPAPADGSADITARYRAVFGVPLIGSKVFLQAKQMIDGWEDEPKEFSAVVPPPA